MKRTELKRKTPLRSRPQQRARPEEPLAARCQGGIWPVCTGKPTDRHHRRRRSQGGGDDDTVDLCRACHMWVHNNPVEAAKRGLLVLRDVNVSPRYL